MNKLSINEVIKIKQEVVEVEETSLLLLKASLNDEKRFNHSLSVMNLCFEIGKANRLTNDDLTKLCFSALLHDFCKNVSVFKLEDICKKNYNSQDFNSMPTFSYHSFACPIIIHEYFAFNDNIVDDAIRFHCTGSSNMSPIGIILYASDKIDPLRGFDSRILIEEMKMNFLSGFKEVLKDNIKYFNRNNIDYKNKYTDECIKFYLP